MKMPRLLIAALLSALTTLSLLLMMQTLIHQETIVNDGHKTRKIADIQMGRTQIDVQVENRKPEKPDTPKTPPQELAAPDIQQVTKANIGSALQAVNISPTLNIETPSFNGPQLSASDGEYLPMVKIQPQYPSRALSRGIEGVCIVEYTVTKTGSVRDPVIVECPMLFETASLNAALKFKYKPRVENGVAVEVLGVRNQFTYKISK